MKKLTRMSKGIWKQLSTPEREDYYYDRGMHGFIKDVAQLLHLDVSKITHEVLTDIANELILITLTRKAEITIHVE